MIEIVNFQFDNVKERLTHENVANFVTDVLDVRIFRKMRTTPFPGMKQPLLNGAIMGLETILEIKLCGKPAANYKWKLVKISTYKNKTIQMGKTDMLGISGELDIGLDDSKYQLIIYATKSQYAILKSSTN